jgi:hypothetical protein
MTKTLITLFVTTAAATVLLAQNPPAQPPPTSQPDTVAAKITGGDPSLPPKYAVPDFISPGGDAKMQSIAKQLGEVLWDDLNFEREVYLISRDT